MNEEIKNELLRILEQLSTDVKETAQKIDKQPFACQVVATHLRRHMAEILILANVIKKIIENDK